MRLVIQRVREASVTAKDKRAVTGPGLAVLWGASAADDERHIDKLAHKTAALRIFEDEQGLMNRSAVQCGFDILVVPNFTLCAETTHGLRPSFTGAAPPDRAQELFARYMSALRAVGGAGRIEQGFFGEEMDLNLQCHGPVTIVMDTEDWS